MRVIGALEECSSVVKCGSVNFLSADDVLDFFAEVSWKEFLEVFCSDVLLSFPFFVLWEERNSWGVELVLCRTSSGASTGSEIEFFSSFLTRPPPATVVVLRANECSLPVSSCASFVVETSEAADVVAGATAFLPFFSPFGSPGFLWFCGL